MPLEAWNALDFHQQSLFHSNTEKENWLCIDFKNIVVFVTGYTIKSRHCDCNTGHPRTWALEGSNDNASWIKLDQQCDDDHFTQRSVTHHFAVQPYCQRFRCLRIRQWGPTYHDDRPWLILGALEFFGDIL